MSTNEPSLSEKVAVSFQQLSVVASDLNAISDELGKYINEIDAALKKLNLGVAVWVQIQGDEDNPPLYWSEDIGYAKIDGRWGISLKKVSGNYAEDDERSECWLFNDGPRMLRLGAIEKIPELLGKLSEEAAKTTEKIKGKLAAAKEVAAAIKSAAEGPLKPRAVSATLKFTVNPATPAPEAKPGLRNIGNVIPQKPATEGVQK